MDSISNLQDDFSEIYNQYIEKIYRFIFLKVDSEEIAEDLCSETFLRCWQNFKKKKSKINNIQAFLYQIARNIITDYYRKRGRTPVFSADEISVIDSNLDSDLEKKSLLDSDVQVVKTAISSLKDDYQNVIICRYIDELSFSEISKLLNKSQGTVRVMLHRALKALKKEIESREA